MSITLADDYLPIPGTIPARAIEVLQEAGRELSSAQMLEALDQPANWHGLGASMKRVIAHGLVRKTLRNGLAFWSLGDGKPLFDATQDEDDEHGEVVTQDGGPSLFANASSVFAVVQGPSTTPTCEISQTGKSEVVHPAAVLTPDDSFDCGLFLGGRLVIEQDGEVFTLKRDNTRKLVHFLERLVPEAAA